MTSLDHLLYVKLSVRIYVFVQNGLHNDTQVRLPLVKWHNKAHSFQVADMRKVGLLEFSNINRLRPTYIIDKDIVNVISCKTSIKIISIYIIPIYIITVDWVGKTRDIDPLFGKNTSVHLLAA